MIFYHRSPCELRIGTKLRHTGNNYAVSGSVENALESERPIFCTPRNESVFVSENREGNHGLKYSGGYDHLVIIIGKNEKRDSCWLGELQKRHHQNPYIKNLTDPNLSQFSDAELAKKYWGGDSSISPNWERVANSAFVLWNLGKHIDSK